MEMSFGVNDPLYFDSGMDRVSAAQALDHGVGEGLRLQEAGIALEVHVVTHDEDLACPARRRGDLLGVEPSRAPIISYPVTPGRLREPCRHVK
jgi:hypothetical protein